MIMIKGMDYGRGMEWMGMEWMGMEWMGMEWGICWVRFGQHSKTVQGAKKEAKNVQGCF